MFLTLQLLTNFATVNKKPSLTIMDFTNSLRQSTFPHSTIIQPATLCLLADTEGHSPLEFSIAIIKDGELATARRWLLKPTMGRPHEHWSMKNIHGLDYQHALNTGVTQWMLVDQLQQWLNEHLGPIPE